VRGRGSGMYKPAKNRKMLTGLKKKERKAPPLFTCLSQYVEESTAIIMFFKKKSTAIRRLPLLLNEKLLETMESENYSRHRTAADLPSPFFLPGFFCV
jgi:hypothetical protein